MTLFDINDVENIEGECSDEERAVSLQRAINSGHAWKMQGSMGRAMMAAIEAGQCMLGREPCRDYWGNRIPSRTEVKAGTKGSREFVIEHSGIEHADLMEHA